jgi:hypothetical protein
MANKKDNNNWFILISVIIIIILVIAFSSPRTDNKLQYEEKLKEEDDRLAIELEELEGRLEIYVKHESINAFTESYMKELCEKRYKQLIQTIIIMLVLLNVIVYFTVPKIDLIIQFTWNGIALGVLNLTAIFFFASVKKGKYYLKGIAMNYIEFQVYENRDKTYFTKKVQFYRDEIERLKQEMLNKRNDLNFLRKNSNNNLSSVENE